jgi:hypothetical protein
VPIKQSQMIVWANQIKYYSKECKKYSVEVRAIHDIPQEILVIEDELGVSLQELIENNMIQPKDI